MHKESLFICLSDNDSDEVDVYISECHNEVIVPGNECNQIVIIFQRHVLCQSIL